MTIPNKKARRSMKTVSRTHQIMKTSSSTLLEIEKRKFPGLTDIFGKKDNSYKRLSKKIFKRLFSFLQRFFSVMCIIIMCSNNKSYICFRSTLSKVAATLDKLDFVKHRDKFGEQFNYVYQT